MGVIMLVENPGSMLDQVHLIQIASTDTCTMYY